MASFQREPKHNHNSASSTALEMAATAARALFLLIGVASTAVLAVRFASPHFLSLLSLSSNLLHNRLWASLVSCLAPPYLFLAVNFIIVAIWRLHGHQRPDEDLTDAPTADDSPPLIPADLSTEPVSSALDPQQEEEKVTGIGDIQFVVSPTSSPPPPAAAAADTVVVAVDKHEEQRPWPPPEVEIREDTNYTPSTDPDSIDSTWQAIMNSKSTTVTPPLKKSDTWEKTSHSRTPADPAPPSILTRAGAPVDRKEFKKSDTFKEGETSSARNDEDKREMRKSKTFREPTRPAAMNMAAVTGWRRRDILVAGHDELFGKVEAFIKMNYDQMRIKRQDSEQKQQQHYVEMLNAAY